MPGSFYRSQFGALGDGGDIAAGDGGRPESARTEGSTQLSVWRTATGGLLWSFTEYAKVIDFSFSGNGRLLYGSGQYGIKSNVYVGGWLWNAETGQELARLQIIGGKLLPFADKPLLSYAPLPLAVSPTGRLVVIGNSRRVYLWLLR